MRNHHLIITFALKSECPPQNRSITSTIPVITLKALQSGGLNALPHTSGPLIIITGVGPQNSLEAAQWIHANLTPKYLLNIGTCHTTTPSKQPTHTWYSPKNIQSQGKRPLKNHPNLPIPWPKNLKPIHYPTTLTTTHTPITQDTPLDIPTDLIDMEAYSYLETFQNTTTSCHILKFASDHPNNPTETQYQESLPILHAQLTTLLNTLTPPNRPDISVIIPTYNRAHTLPRALDSVQNQTLQPSQIIVVDDASTDHTVKTLKNYPTITTLTHTTNQGVSAARNTGISHSNSTWIALLDSDDEWTPTKLENQWKYLQQHPYYAIIQSEEKWVRNGKHLNKKKYHTKHCGWQWGLNLERCMISPSSVLFKKDLWAQYGPFDTDLIACEDYDLWLAITRHLPIGLESTPSLIKYGGHTDQLSNTPKLDEYRLLSLLKHLKNETHPAFIAEMTLIINKKLEIMINGADKRKTRHLLHKQIQDYYTLVFAATT